MGVTQRTEYFYRLKEISLKINWAVYTSSYCIRLTENSAISELVYLGPILKSFGGFVGG